MYSYLTPYTGYQFLMEMMTSEKGKTLNPLVNNKEYIFKLEVGKDFLNKIQNTQTKKGKIDKLDHEN